ncbi:metalloregulator ArsR/SmtB family transcription factor [Ferroacidibacillus organovorans]|uniref:ArsR family transcriptional regulator n=1 Tax=Ferroacidibacillus organovorans TaxID=1765683 RepID=A0A101XT74_9BACL|nr:metalloregulator ArsR/SmtB family transcription factor [Ferroacidibacillus organovorans]KUO97123.1 ArsR family transcriptional regulator [Ferroacidibacillus organovorans]
MTSEDNSMLVQFLKVLADESRLRILGILTNRGASVEELAAALSLKTPTISHHLTRLRELGLVRMRPEGTVHVYEFNAEALQRVNLLLKPEQLAQMANVEGDAWERKVLRDFLNGEELKEIPASRKKRAVILAWLVEKFDVGTRYAEADVNAIIKRHHPDYATLRRELIATHLMERENAVYWRTPQEQNP